MENAHLAHTHKNKMVKRESNILPVASRPHSEWSEFPLFITTGSSSARETSHAYRCPGIGMNQHYHQRKHPSLSVSSFVPFLFFSQNHKETFLFTMYGEFLLKTILNVENRSPRSGYLFKLSGFVTPTRHTCLYFSGSWSARGSTLASFICLYKLVRTVLAAPSAPTRISAV